MGRPAARWKEKAKRTTAAGSGMKQRSMVGTSLLLLAAVSAILAIVSSYTFAKKGGDGLDAAYAWAAIIITVVCGVWGYYFFRSPKANPEPETTETTAPATK